MVGIALIPKKTINSIDPGTQINRLKQGQKYIGATFVKLGTDGTFVNSAPQNRKVDLKDLLSPVVLAKGTFDQAREKYPVGKVTTQQILSQKAEARRPRQVGKAGTYPYNPVTLDFASNNNLQNSNKSGTREGQFIKSMNSRLLGYACYHFDKKIGGNPKALNDDAQKQNYLLQGIQDSKLTYDDIVRFARSSGYSSDILAVAEVNNSLSALDTSTKSD